MYKILEGVKSKIGISGNNPEDWKGVTKKSFAQHGGQGLLAQHNGSLFETLDSLFPDKFWYKHIRMDNNHFSNQENQKKFLQVKLNTSFSFLFQ